MAEGNPSSFAISVHDFDKSLLPPHARTPGTDAFNSEVTKRLIKEYSAFGGSARIVINKEIIQVTWRSGDDDPMTVALRCFNSGNYPTGIAMLRSLLRQYPDDSELLYNLGMALSDVGELQESETYLRRVVAEQPTNVNATVALGVAQQRQERTNEAIETLKHAVELDGENPWAHRNLGACLLAVGQQESAKDHLQRATTLNPDDQQAWFGLGQVYESLDDPASADDCYAQIIKLDPDSQLSEHAKQRRSQIGQAEMRGRVGGGMRPDAVMYCLAALEKFAALSPAERQTCAFEIAMRGQRGFDFNDSTPKYEFRSLEGKFSGLQSLAYMYVAFKYVAPEHNIGFDLAKEYAAAKAMFSGKAP
jgi:tetratricopeptide (TPR) repeat protein